MKFVAILRKHYSLHVLLPLAAILCGCGGSPLEDDPMLAPAKQYGTSATNAPGKRAAQQGEFNLDIWNEHKWYECDCARDSTPPVGG